jgi:hypothetical protein
MAKKSHKQTQTIARDVGALAHSPLKLAFLLPPWSSHRTLSSRNAAGDPFSTRIMLAEYKFGFKKKVRDAAYLTLGRPAPQGKRICPFGLVPQLSSVFNCPI